MVRYFIIAAFLCLPLTPTPLAQTVNPEQLDELSAQQAAEKEKADALNKNRQIVSAELGKLKKNLTQIAAEAGVYERKGRKIETRLTALQSEQISLQKSIYGDRKTLMQLLAALQRVEINPPPALALSPDDASDAARAGRLMSTLSANLKAHADKLSVKLEDLNTLSLSIKTEQNELVQIEAALETRRQSIKSKVSEKAKLERSISKDQDDARRRVAAIAAQADSLRDLIQQFEQSTRTVTPRLKPQKGAPAPKTPKSNPRSSVPVKPLDLPKGTKPFSQSKGSITPPVTGQIAKPYTTARKGLTVKTRAKAQVVAPAAGRIEFSGPFKNYENVVILNVGGGYFMLLTGLGEIYVESKEMVTRGEPLGLMPFNTNSPQELYIELRKDGSTINPSAWFGTAFAGNG